jgi:V8-like Glu-specific endopeptidase
LGGNSGSPLVSLSTGELVGVHASGYFSYRNTGVAAGELAAFLKDAGVN